MRLRVLMMVMLLVALGGLISRSLFTVGQSQVALRTEFGRIVGAAYGPGLHLRWPTDEVVKLDRRILSQSYTGENLVTRDARSLGVDFYVKWRIKDAATYFGATGASEDVAGVRVAEIVKGCLKEAIAQHSLEQLITQGRTVLTPEMLEEARSQVGTLGVQLLDVRVLRLDLPDEVASRIYESMKEGFASTAGQLRAEGQGRAATIRAEADRRRMEILSTAQEEALRLRGQSDAEAARIYAQAYSKNPEFYAFYRSLQAYRNALGKDGDLLVLSPDGEFFKYLKQPDPPPRTSQPQAH